MNLKLSTSAAVLASGLLVAGAGVAAATIPAADGTIHGCYITANGNLRVVDEGVPCHSSETQLDWSQVGPEGPAGPQGPAGAEGPEGPQGVPGSAVPARKVVRTVTAAPGGQAQLTAGCNADEYLVNGGYSAVVGNAFPRVTVYSASAADVDGDGILDTYFAALTNNEPTDDVELAVIAWCAPLSQDG